MTDALPPLERTLDLVHRVQSGDAVAADDLVRRYEPLLRRWAHGRLPAYARDLADTEDLVQVALTNALQHIDGFRSDREGAFLAYLRNSVLNALRDHVRRFKRRPGHTEWDDALDVPAVAMESVGIETLITYERALDKLSDQQREAVVLRIEFGYPFADIARAHGASPGGEHRFFKGPAGGPRSHGPGRRPGAGPRGQSVAARQGRADGAAVGRQTVPAGFAGGRGAGNRGRH